MGTRLLSSLVSQSLVGPDRIIAGLTLDSRQIGENYLFIAMKGERQDGHEYIRQAIDGGAVAVALENAAFIQPDSGITYVNIPSLRSDLGHIASCFYGQPTTHMVVFGVTGTNGKTSTTHYISEMLKVLGRPCAVIGTLGMDWNGRHVETGNTTPDAITLQKGFCTMLEDGVATVAMEVSSHALEQQRCAGIRFDTAIMTNVTHDHLDYHGSFQAYLDAKMKLFSTPELRLAIVNADDVSALRIREIVSGRSGVITYSARNTSADVYLEAISAESDGYRATLNYRGERFPFAVSLLGEFNLYNVLAAIIALKEQGYVMSAVLNAAAGLSGVGGRMQKIPNGHGIVAVVDYAHTPDALGNVLVSLRQQVTGRIIVVFGCGGDRDRSKRPGMGAIAEKQADYIVVTSDNPRSEDPSGIITEICSGFCADRYVVEADRAAAIRLAVNMARPGDCVLVAGKGHEKTQVIGDEILPFDDVIELAAALDGKEILPC